MRCRVMLTTVTKVWPIQSAARLLVGYLELHLRYATISCYRVNADERPESLPPARLRGSATCAHRMVDLRWSSDKRPRVSGKSLPGGASNRLIDLSSIDAQNSDDLACIGCYSNGHSDFGVFRVRFTHSVSLGTCNFARRWLKASNKRAPNS